MLALDLKLSSSNGLWNPSPKGIGDQFFVMSYKPLLIMVLRYSTNTKIIYFGREAKNLCNEAAFG